LHCLHSFDCTFSDCGCGRNTFWTIFGISVKDSGANKNYHRHGWYNSRKENAGETSIENESNDECYNEVTDGLYENSHFLGRPRLDSLCVYRQAASNLENVE
jgi:hypothetical protein